MERICCSVEKLQASQQPAEDELIELLHHHVSALI
jgi:hypothetical protein